MTDWWNQDFTSESGYAYAKQTGSDDDCFVRNVFNALQQRMDYTGGGSPVSTADIGDKFALGGITAFPSTTGTGLANWRESAMGVGDSFVKKYNPDWTRWTPQGMKPFLAADPSTSLTVVNGGANFDDSLFYPYVDGVSLRYDTAFDSLYTDYDIQPVTRSWRREIYKTTQAGTSGWRARFGVYNKPLFARRFHNIECADALYDTVVTTTSGEEKYAGIIFEHDGTSWSVSDDQVSPVDKVTELTAGYGGNFDADGHLIANTNGKWNPGQIIDGQLLNDLRDYINHMDIVPANGALPVGDVPGYTLANSYEDADLRWSAGSIADRTGFGHTQALASGTTSSSLVFVGYASTAAAHTPSVDNTGDTRALTYQRYAPSGNDYYGVERAKGTFHLPALTGDPMNNPDTLEREVSWWGCGSPPLELNAPPELEIGQIKYDDYGDGVAAIWQEFSSRVTTSGTAAATLLGSLTIPSPWSDDIDRTLDRDDDGFYETWRGYVLFPISVMLDYGATTNGFTFTRLTPTS